MKPSFSFSSSNPPKPSLNPSHNKPFFTESDPPQNPNPNPNHLHHPPTRQRIMDTSKQQHEPNRSTRQTRSRRNISYGLNLRAKKGSAGSSHTRNVDRFKSDSWIERILLKKLKRDLDSLPEDGGMDEFEDMPVESFAHALLKGYGWYEGRGVGKNPKEDVKVFEIKRKRGRGGIGFVNIMPPVFAGKDRKQRAANLEMGTVSNEERKETNDSMVSRDHKRDHDKKTSSKRGRERERERYETSGGSSNSKSWLKSHIRDHKRDAGYDKETSSKRGRKRHETSGTFSKSWLRSLYTGLMKSFFRLRFLVVVGRFLFCVVGIRVFLGVYGRRIWIRKLRLFVMWVRRRWYYGTDNQD